MLFQAPNLAIKSLLISPRDMVLEIDEGTPEARVDPDVDDVMSVDKDESAQDEDEDDDDQETPKVAAEAETNTTEAEPEVKETTEEEPKVQLPELDTLSSKFNETFVVETLDPVQTAEVINPQLKTLLLKNPSFIVDFQDKKFLIYREFTFEGEDYGTVLEMGRAILENLNRTIPAASKESQEIEASQVFVSRSKDKDTP
jgi:hypothetical protein